MSLPNHGANPEQFTKALGLKMKGNSLDFSVNTNPFGPPPQLKEMWESYYRFIEHYPDPNASALREAIAHKEHLYFENVLIGNGAAELILLIANLYRGKRALIVEPSFSEYRDACHAYDCDVQSVMLMKEDGWQLPVERIIEALPNVDLLFICHPNNPTGVMYQKPQLEYVIKEAGFHGVTVVIDEAFYDFHPALLSLSSSIPTESNLIVLRSLTKMYGIAGIRLGYALASREVIAALKKFQQPWSVNGIAQQIGLVCLEEKMHAISTANKIASERIRMTIQLQQLGYDVSPSSVNFFLITEEKMQQEMELFLRFLIEHHIIPRHTYNFPGLDGKYIRLAVKLPEENDRLLHVLQRWKT